MFATILRRWRIVTPVATAMVALSLVVSAFISPASAHTLHFAFSGDAADFINYSTSPAFFDCFSGWLSKSGAEINSGPLSACESPGFDISPDSPGELSSFVFADVARWDLTGTNSSTGGHTTANSEVFGELDNGDDGVVVGLDSLEGYGSDAKEVFIPIVVAEDVDETAVASCHKQGNHGSASAKADLTNIVHLRVINSGVAVELNGVPPANPHNNVFASYTFDAVATATGSIGDSTEIVRSFTFEHQDLILEVITNDHRTWVNGNTSASTGDGLHVIVQTEDGEIAADLVIAHAHADIECAFSLHSFSDPFGV